MAEQQPHNRGRRCCCCLFSVLITIIVLFVLIILLVWVIIQPRFFNFNVKEAKLTQFNYTNNDNTLHYNLVLNFTARNPNKKLNIYYDKIEGNAFYEGTRFATTDVITWLNSFRQYTKSTDRMSGVFSGKRVIVFDDDQVSEFEHDKRDGVFHIDVKLYFTIRYRLGDFICGHTKGNIKCKLEVPFGSNGTAFQPTKCDVNF